MIDARLSSETFAAASASGQGLEERFSQVFPKGLPARQKLQAVGIFLSDECSMDVHVLCEQLARQVQKNADALRGRLVTTTLASRKALVGALLAFAGPDGVADGTTVTYAGADGLVPMYVTRSADALEGAVTTTVPPVPDGKTGAESRREGYPAGELGEIWADFHVHRTLEARNKLLEHYMPLVKYNAERIWARLPEGVELDDLQSAGVFGLMDALDAFDLSRGVKFETYCVPRIRGAMLDELRTMDWVPRLVRSKAAKINEATKSLEVHLGRTPTVAELAKHMALSVQDMEAMLKEVEVVGLISLDKKWYETDSYKDVREIDILADTKAPNPATRLSKHDVLRKVTKGMNRNERLVIIGYYYQQKTMKEIGAELGLSESRVSQMHSAMVERLRKMLHPEELQAIGV